jgi:hypothetical protein
VPAWPVRNAKRSDSKLVPSPVPAFLDFVGAAAQCRGVERWILRDLAATDDPIALKNAVAWTCHATANLGAAEDHG